MPILSPPRGGDFIKEAPMKISAGKEVKGTVDEVVHGSVNSEVFIELPGGTEIISIITKT